MSEEFKRKLDKYEKGELIGQELEVFERELEKLEEYQSILEDRPVKPTKTSKELSISNRKQHRIVRKGKWRARFQTALTALGIFVLFTILSSILTSVYYSWGQPDRSDEFREMIDHTLTITNPYGSHGGTSTGTKPYFGLEAVRDMNKEIGNESIKVGEVKVNFLFSFMSYPERTYIGKESQSQPLFIHPESTGSVESDWNKLEKLPEGTVASAYVSFTELMESKEVEQLFTGEEMHLIWMAVDTGMDLEEEIDLVLDPIGFPGYPIWHEDDMIKQSHEVEEGPFGSKVVSESFSSLPYNEGDQEMLHNQFMKTLNFLKEHENKADKLYDGNLKLEERIAYLENNGIFHYGAVITGPTKAILKLQNEPMVAELLVDEVEFWNWD